MGMPIDMLILNAGIMALPELEQVNGLEKQFVTNHLGHFIVGNRLLPQVQAAPRAGSWSSPAAATSGRPRAGIEFDNLSGERGLRAQQDVRPVQAGELSVCAPAGEEPGRHDDHCELPCTPASS